METIPYEDFAKLDIRVARVVAAEPIPGKTRVMKGTIDAGGDPTDVIIGGAEHYAPSDMIGRLVVAITNLQPKELAGVRSGAMLLAADGDGMPLWLAVPDGTEPGTPVR